MTAPVATVTPAPSMVPAATTGPLPTDQAWSAGSPVAGSDASCLERDPLSGECCDQYAEGSVDRVLCEHDSEG
jgi:hypothetical protein